MASSPFIIREESIIRGGKMVNTGEEGDLIPTGNGLRPGCAQPVGEVEDKFITAFGYL
jgi:hypothetical protein